MGKISGKVLLAAAAFDGKAEKSEPVVDRQWADTMSIWML